MNQKFDEILVYNRVGTLRRVTVEALKRLNYSSIKEFSSKDELEKELKLDIQFLLILEITGENPVSELELIQKYSGRHRMLVTLQISSKELILKLSRAGAKNVLLKSLDIGGFSEKLQTALGPR